MLTNLHPYSGQGAAPRPVATPLSVLLPLTLLILLSAPVFVRLFFDYMLFGDGWRQGDWLINFGSGLVRRGLLGESFIWLSDASGLSLRLIIILSQAALWTNLVWLSWLIWQRYPHRNLLILLFASPMIFFLTWAGDVQGIMRKEILGYLAIACLILCSLSATRRSAIALGGLGVGLFTLGLIGNILHLFLAPAMLTGLYFLKQQGRLRYGVWLLYSGLSAAMALLWFGFALMFKDIPDLTGVCEPLLQRDMNQAICDHAIRWLVAGDVDHGAQVAVRITLASVLQFTTVALIGVIPLALAAHFFKAWRRVTIIVLICFVPTLPLYIIATDWGRFFSISYTMAISLILIAQVTMPRQKLRRPSEATLALLLTTSFLMTPAHGIGWQAGGVIASLLKTIADLI